MKTNMIKMKTKTIFLKEEVYDSDLNSESGYQSDIHSFWKSLIQTN